MTKTNTGDSIYHDPGRTMKRKLKDYIGMEFDRWTVHSIDQSRKKALWCDCKCGKRKSVLSYHLTSGSSRSCGCFRSEENVIRLTTHGHSKKVGVTPEYRAWLNMKTRVKPCFSQRADYYDRGITVDPSWWDNFTQFLRDMGPMPSAGYTLERKENDKGYGPSNCVWATRSQQNNNTRRNRILELNGERKNLTQWANQFGINAQAVMTRLRMGWSVKEALLTPIRRHKQYKNSA